MLLDVVEPRVPGGLADVLGDGVDQNCDGVDGVSGFAEVEERVGALEGQLGQAQEDLEFCGERIGLAEEEIVLLGDSQDLNEAAIVELEVDMARRPVMETIVVPFQCNTVSIAAGDVRNSYLIDAEPYGITRGMDCHMAHCVGIGGIQDYDRCYGIRQDGDPPWEIVYIGLVEPDQDGLCRAYFNCFSGGILSDAYILSDRQNLWFFVLLVETRLTLRVWIGPRLAGTFKRCSTMARLRQACTLCTDLWRKRLCLFRYFVPACSSTLRLITTRTGMACRLLREIATTSLHRCIAMLLRCAMTWTMIAMGRSTRRTRISTGLPLACGS